MAAAEENEKPDLKTVYYTPRSKQRNIFTFHGSMLFYSVLLSCCPCIFIVIDFYEKSSDELQIDTYIIICLKTISVHKRRRLE